MLKRGGPWLLEGTRQCNGCTCGQVNNKVVGDSRLATEIGSSVSTSSLVKPKQVRSPDNVSSSRVGAKNILLKENESIRGNDHRVFTFR